MSDTASHAREDRRAKGGMSPKEARQARECALRALFQLDLAGGEPEEALRFAASEDVAGELGAKSMEYAERIVKGVVAAKDAIDSTIARISKDWSLDRMAYADRNIMRIAVFEMTEVEGMSFAVAINEAVELGKTFGTEESPRFINGIVGRLAEELKTV